MKTKNIDAMIREALDEEDLDYFDFEEPSIPEKVTSLFQGRGRWLNVMAFILVFVLFLVSVYCGIRFFESDDGWRWSASPSSARSSVSNFR